MTATELIEMIENQIDRYGDYEIHSDCNINQFLFFNPTDDCIKKMIDAGKKYRITNIFEDVNGKRLYRIQALVDINRRCYEIKAGDIGGFIEKEENLSHEGECWIAEDAKVYDNAKVYGNAHIADDAQVYGNAQVYGDALVAGGSEVYNDAKVYGKAFIIEEVKIYDNAQVYSDNELSGYAQVYENAQVYEHAQLFDTARVHGNAKVHGRVQLGYIHDISGDTDLFNDDQLPRYYDEEDEEWLREYDEDEEGE